MKVNKAYLFYVIRASLIHKLQNTFEKLSKRIRSDISISLLFLTKSNLMSDIIVLKHSSGATASVNLFGATVFSWILPSGKEVFYLSKLTDTTGKKPIRGGIPIVFPQFNNGN